MLKRYIGITMAFVLLVSYSASCAPQEAPPVSYGGPVTDYVSLIDNLRKEGANVEPAGEVNQPFFSVIGQAIIVNGENIQVFEYKDEADADVEASLVSPDGSSIGTSIASWIAPPHFFRAGKIIVLYVGENREALSLLESVLGPQFAGR